MYDFLILQYITIHIFLFMKIHFTKSHVLFGLIFLQFFLLFPVIGFSQKSHYTPRENEAINLEFSHTQGFYSEPFYLKVLNLPENTTVHYTTNGSEPTIESDTINNVTGLFIDYPQQNSNPISLIPTNPLDTPYPWYVWKTPDDLGFKAGIYKMKLFSGNIPVSNSFSLTYFVAENLPAYLYSLPVVSIVTDPSNLFDYESGIYVPGILYDANPTWTWWGGNSGNYRERGIEWEKPGNFAFFEPGGLLAFQQEIGLRINGGGTRIFPQKSLRIYARSEYGVNKIYYPIFPQKDQPDFKRLIISNNGQDFITGGMNDVLVAAMLNKLNLDIQEYRFCITYLNGEYWGIQCIRERLDKYYVKDKFGVDEDNVDIITGNGFPEEGDTISYKEMYNFIVHNDLSQDANYQYIENLIDVDGFIEYNICKQYIGSTDWPGNNVECWRERKDGAKWRWFFFDNNGALIHSDSQILEKSLEEGGTGWPNPDWSTLILRKMMQNRTFKEQYFIRFNELYRTNFSPEFMIHIIDSVSNLITDALPDHIERWKYPTSMQIREERIDLMKKFAEERPEIIRQQIIDLFYHDYLQIAEPLPVSELIKCFYNDGFIYVENPISNTVRFELFDIQGKLLKQEIIAPLSTNLINADELRGVYLVRFTSAGKQSSKKLVIM